MAKTKTPKLSKRSLQRQQGTKSLSSAEDYLDQGVAEEESGDRWLISDLSKALRFYQKAYEHYTESVRLNTNFFDAYYNLCRLLYHVYENYKIIPPAALSGTDDCLVMNFSIMDIKQRHEFVLNAFQSNDKEINWEFNYNLVLINTEILETSDWSFEEIQQICNANTQLLNTIFDHQLNELDSFLRDLEHPEMESAEIPSSVKNNVDDNNDEDLYSVTEQIIPSTVLDSVITASKFIQAVYDNCGNNKQIGYFEQSLEMVSNRLDMITNILLTRFNPDTNLRNEHNLNLDKEQIKELNLTNACTQASKITEYNELVQFWDHFEGQEDSAKYLAQVDSLEVFRSRQATGLNPEQVWILANQMNQYLKKAQELLQLELQEHIRLKTADISKIVSKIVDVLINRADNDLCRSMISDYEPSVKNKDILRQNSINLLKSGMNISKTNCGLRETAIDKIKREKVRRECVIRLVLLTKITPTEDDLIRNLGAQFYKQEIQDLKMHDVYDEVFQALL